jgi:glycosyltransferase involved in cell wall biosynthesis
MLKVLLLNDHMGRGGKERRIAELLTYSKKHFDVCFEIVITNSEFEYPQVLETGYKVHIIDRDKVSTYQCFRKIVSICKDFNPDIIHSWSSLTDLFGLYLKLTTGKKFISSMIARVAPKKSLADKDYRRSKIVFPFADIITANTKAGLESYNTPVSKGICIYNGFNQSRLNNLSDPSVLKHKLGIEGKFIVGMVAAFELRKDHETVINSAKQLIETYPGKFAFVFVGNGTYLEDRKLQAGDNLDKDIKFIGMVHNAEDYINIFDVGILCTNSSVHGEGISNSIMEYMAFGKPAIATEGGGTREIIVDGESGYIIEPQNPAALTSSIIELVKNPEDAREMGEAGRNIIKNKFSIEAMCNSFYGIYCKLAPAKLIIKKPIRDVSIATVLTILLLT